MNRNFQTFFCLPIYFFSRSSTVIISPLLSFKGSRDTSFSFSPSQCLQSRLDCLPSSLGESGCMGGEREEEEEKSANMRKFG